MNGNKSELRIQGSRVGKALAFLFALSPAIAHAQGAAPGMFGVKEIVVQYAHFTDAGSADSCGIEREDLAETLNKALVNDKLPAIAAADAKPPMLGIARIDLVPEISTINEQGLDCVSWVSLVAQSRNNARIPPVDILRNVTVNYWRQVTTVSSSQSTHGHLVAETLQKMAAQFAQQYHLDQPPDTSVPGGQ